MSAWFLKGTVAALPSVGWTAGMLDSECLSVTLPLSVLDCKRSTVCLLRRGRTTSCNHLE